ncbi:SDR family NAD(P)-dependent oxidoreductase [Pararhodobacter sp. SW119]|uniref:SDR family NAD(P)-dependent oxidoreductase n=1 Tax=Pararhodobacter sp. SW119 TaxID=2780075 RepID=UPI001AE0E3F5|nr:SDR family NAD(P)-dependent oxidoreductase [Pararhodobacter sp. SW119]
MPAERPGARVLLITGCSSGIGLDAARTMAARGWRVFAACRKAEDCDRLRAEGLESPRIDHADPESIDTGLAEVLAATGGRLDALFNNGAFATPGAVEDLPTDALRAIFEANLFGWHDLTRRVIPVMRAQGQGRIVHCSSVLGFTPMPWRGAYVATKFALEGLTHVLRMEMRDTPLKIILIEPGPISTRFRINARAQFERWIDWQASPRAGQYRDRLLQRLYADTGPDRFELPPAAVTRKLIHALESPRPRRRYFVTVPTWAMAALMRLLPLSVLDRLLARV